MKVEAMAVMLSVAMPRLLPTVFGIVAPQRVDILLQLVASRFRHLGENVGFHGALICANLYYLHFHSELVEQLLEERCDARYTVDVNGADGVEHHGVGRRGHKVVALAVRVGVGIYPLALFLEAAYGFDEFFACGHTHCSPAAVYVETLYALVVGCIVDGHEHFFKGGASEFSLSCISWIKEVGW